MSTFKFQTYCYALTGLIESLSKVPGRIYFYFVFIFSPFIAHTQDGKPNIILILIDDLGYGELPVYGNTFNETPYIGQMASEGMTFTHAYSSGTVCSPSRASLHTGQYTPRHGIYDFIPEESPMYLDPAEHTTINEALSDAGYYTGLIGKWHLDPDYAGDNPGGPDKHGFDMVFCTETKYIGGGDYFYPYDKISTITEGEVNEFLPDRLFNEADSFIRRHKEEPFFLSLQLFSVHMTLEGPDTLVDKYKAKYEDKYGAGSSAHFDDGQPRVHAGAPDNPYMAAMLERIDAGVGNLMNTLDELNMDEETLLILTSDNGGDEFVANNGGLRGAKTWLYEGGIRIPMIVRYPGKCLAGTENDTPVNFIDFYPTFMELAGATTDQVLDGVSMVPLFQNNSIERDEMYWWYPTRIRAWDDRRGSVIRKGDYKLIYFYSLGPDHYELYNLVEDPSEENNLYDAEPLIANELKEKLNTWMSEMKFWGQTPLPETFENASTVPRWFNAHQTASSPRIVENPDKTGINTSDSVMLWIKDKNAKVFAAAMSDFSYGIKFNGNNTYIHLKMLKDNTDPCVLQVIRTMDGVVENGKYDATDPIRVPCPIPNQWVDYVFGFTDTAATNHSWSRFYFMPVMNSTEPMGWTPDPLDADVNVYFDDIIIDSVSTSYGSNATTVFVDKEGHISCILNNPVSNELILEDLGDIEDVRIYSINGSQVKQITDINESACRIPVSDLPVGVYLVAFRYVNGKIDVSKIIKR